MRASSLLFALALAGCGRAEPPPAPLGDVAGPPAVAPTLEPTVALAPPPEPPAVAGTAPDSRCSGELDSDWSHAEPPRGIKFVISKAGLGPVHLGMTLEAARKALPSSHRFVRGSDGEGVAWVDVMVGEHALMSLYAGEEDFDAPIDWAARIQVIQSFSKATSTADGVSVGDLLVDAERTYGPVREIIESEIESRQFVEFERQPGVDMRIDYSGDFAPHSSSTKRYCPGARIYAMSVAHTVEASN